MARNRTHSVPNLAAGKVPDNTRFYIDIDSADGVQSKIEAYERRQEYDADTDAWAAAHPGEKPPHDAPFCEAVDPSAPTIPERNFIQCRFKIEDEANPGSFIDEIDDWVQISAVNFPGPPNLTGLSPFAAHRLMLKHFYETRRAARGLVPTP